MVALFGRAQVRDFADVYRLAERFGKEALLAEATAADPGFEVTVFVQMMASLDRFDDDESAHGAGPPKTIYGSAAVVPPFVYDESTIIDWRPIVPRSASLPSDSLPGSAVYIMIRRSCRWVVRMSQSKSIVPTCE